MEMHISKFRKLKKNGWGFNVSIQMNSGQGVVIKGYKVVNKYINAPYTRIGKNFYTDVLFTVAWVDKLYELVQDQMRVDLPGEPLHVKEVATEGLTLTGDLFDKYMNYKIEVEEEGV